MCASHAQNDVLGPLPHWLRLHADESRQTREPGDEKRDGTINSQVLFSTTLQYISEKIVIGWRKVSQYNQRHLYKAVESFE